MGEILIFEKLISEKSFFLPARWCSGDSVRIAVGRPGVHSQSRVIPKKLLKNGIYSFPAWRSA